MIVQVEQIRDEGLELDVPIRHELLTEALEEMRDTGFRARGPSRLKATLHKVSGGVLLQGSFQADVVAPCKRCLADVEQTLPVAFTLNLISQAKVAEAAGAEDDEDGGTEGSFDLEAADAELFDGKKIDLDPILREQVLLALPMYAVCREDCKGLCPMCGQNLNERKCGCAPRTVDPRLAVLKDIKLS